MSNEPRLAVESIAGQRPYQEDSVLAETFADGRTLIAVADGMGGHAAGEVASALALEALNEAIVGGQSLREAFALANSRVHVKAGEPGKQGMGTTLVAVLIDGNEFSVANVGDSRCYLISAEGIRRLTEDHSFVAEAMKQGQSEEEAMATPWRDALTRSIGTEDEVEIDVFGPFPLEPDSAFLTCSDGLYKTLSDQELHELFGSSGSVRAVARSLVAAAYDAGSDDNISVAVAEYGEVPRQSVRLPEPSEAFSAESAAESSEAAASAEEGRDESARGPVGESSVVGGLPAGVLAVILLIVGALVATLFFGG